MKQFFKFMFASMVGTILTFGLFFIFFILLIVSIASFSKKDTTAIPSQSVLYLNLKGPIIDRAAENPLKGLSGMGFNMITSTGLQEIVANLKKAAADPKIKGIFMEMPDLETGSATVEEMRNALLEFKKSGKFIISYSEYYTQKAYYLASVSDKIYMCPEGLLEFKGISAQVVFFKGALDKLDVEMQVIRHGKYKSAVEPFMTDKMSPENKEQMQQMVSSIWVNTLQKIAESRKISVEELNSMASELRIQNPEDAVKYKLIDGLAYRTDVYSDLHKLTGTPAHEKINLVTLDRYNDSPSTLKRSTSRDKIAVIWAAGEMVMGEESDNNITGEKYARAIRQAREDKSVKAIVLRINSPGGVMTTADVILHEVLQAAKEKPVVASFGDYAASGGYYVGCGAKVIVAEPTTITGSIGVFGLIPNFRKTLNNKLGITLDGVKTNENADFISLTQPMTPFQKEVMQRGVERSYQVFLGHVSDGRKMPVGKVDEIGQGRVWTGTQAKEIGLVDQIGGLDKAIETAASLAKLKDYRVVDLPKLKDPLTQILDNLQGKYENETLIKKEFGEMAQYYQYLKFVKSYSGTQARLPFEIQLN